MDQNLQGMVQLNEEMDKMRRNFIDDKSKGVFVPLTALSDLAAKDFEIFLVSLRKTSGY